MARIYLSPPAVGERGRALVLEAIESGWIAPVGPDLDAFEADVARTAGRAAAVGVASGTAALHLALLAHGVGPGDEVVVSTLTFVATPNAVTYTGATPRFVDSAPDSWQLDPELLADELGELRAAGRPAKAVIAVDLYGRCADYDAIEAVCAEHGAVLIEDAAEAIGATHRGRPAGSFGAAAIFSFNGNKLLTTSGGGMVVTDDTAVADRVRKLATQAREPVAHYEHTEVGYNYRLSNLLAALGRAQIAELEERVRARRAIRDRYVASLGSLPGVEFLADDPDGRATHWLSVCTIDPEVAGVDRDEVSAALEAADIESRPVWKPMHLQPVYADAPFRGRGVADAVWRTGLCLPSGHELAPADQDRIIEIVASSVR